MMPRNANHDTPMLTISNQSQWTWAIRGGIKGRNECEQISGRVSGVKLPVRQIMFRLPFFTGRTMNIYKMSIASYLTRSLPALLNSHHAPTAEHTEQSSRALSG
jgi:hypothetical protein